MQSNKLIGLGLLGYALYSIMGTKAMPEQLFGAGGGGGFSLDFSSLFGDSFSGLQSQLVGRTSGIVETLTETFSSVKDNVTESVKAVTKPSTGTSSILRGSGVASTPSFYEQALQMSFATPEMARKEFFSRQSKTSSEATRQKQRDIWNKAVPSQFKQ